MPTSNPIDIERLLSGPRNSPIFTYIIAWSLALMFIEGYDMQTTAYAAPALIKEWGVNKALFGPVFSASLVGYLAGAVHCLQHQRSLRAQERHRLRRPRHRHLHLRRRLRHQRAGLDVPPPDRRHRPRRHRPLHHRAERRIRVGIQPRQTHHPAVHRLHRRHRHRRLHRLLHDPAFRLELGLPHRRHPPADPRRRCGQATSGIHPLPRGQRTRPRAPRRNRRLAAPRSRDHAAIPLHCRRGKPTRRARARPVHRPSPGDDHAALARLHLQSGRPLFPDELAAHPCSPPAACR